MPRGSSQQPVPIALGQEREWEFMYSLAPDNPGRSGILVIDNRYVDGYLNLAALHSAFAAVIRQHETLRLVFHTVAPDPLMLVAEEVEPPVEFLDLSGQSAARQDAAVSELVFLERERCFDLCVGPLWHAWIVRLEPTRHLLSLCFSHIIADGWSCKVFMNDLMDAYALAADGRSPTPGGAPSFREIRELQRRRLDSRPDRVAYWREQLLPLPATGLQTPLGNVDLRSSIGIEFSLHAELVRALRRVAWRARTTPFTALLACYYVLLSTSRNTTRIVGKTTTMGRPTPLERRAICQFTADLYMPVTVEDQLRLIDVVRTTYSSMECALGNVMSFASIARAVNPDFDQNRPWPDAYLFDCNCGSVAFTDPDLTISNLHVRQVYIAGDQPPGYRNRVAALENMAPYTQRAWQAECAPSIIIEANRDSGALCFNDKLFDAAEMRRFLSSYIRIVKELCSDPETTVAAMRRNMESPRRKS